MFDSRDSSIKSHAAGPVAAKNNELVIATNSHRNTHLSQNAFCGLLKHVPLLCSVLLCVLVSLWHVYAFILCLFNLHIYCCAVQKINISKAIFQFSGGINASFCVCILRCTNNSVCAVCINSINSLDNRGVYFCIQIFEIRSSRTSNIVLCEWNGFMHTHTNISKLTECGTQYFFSL